MAMPKKSAAGDFPFRMTILRDVGTTKNAAGHRVADWQPFTKVWGGEEITSGRELWKAMQVQPDISSIIKTRYVAGITSKMRVVPKQGSSRTLEITAVKNVGSFNVELELWCKEAL
jgi:SPP1 family predicted phage head-tail adaptor